MDEILDSGPFRSTSSAKPTLRELAENGFEFDFGKYLTQGFQLWTKDIWNGTLYTLLMLIISFVASVTVLGPLFISGPLLAGYLIAADKIAKGQKTSMSDYFGGFKYFGPLLGFSLIIFALIVLIYAIILALGLAMGLLGSAGGGAVMGIGGVFLFAIFILALYALAAYLMAIWWFVHPFIIFGKLGARDAMKASAAVSRKNFWWFLLIAVVASFAQSIGMMALYIGFLVTYAIGSFIKYAAYSQIIGLGNKNSQVSEL